MFELIDRDKTVYFYTDFNKTDELVRTGVIRNDSFFHSVLYLSSPTYSSMTIDERNTLATELKLLTSVQDKSTLKIKFLSHLRTAYTETSSTVDPDDLQACIVFFQMVTYDDFAKEIVPRALESTTDFKVALLKETEVFHRKKFLLLRPDERSAIGQSKINRCIQKLSGIVEKIYNEIPLRKIPGSGVTGITKEVVKRVSEHIGKDIYFFKGEERTPFTLTDPAGRNSIIVVNQNDSYEPISKLLPNKKLQKEFAQTEGLIVRLKESTKTS
jgi:hypothetical protein